MNARLYQEIPGRPGKSGTGEDNNLDLELYSELDSDSDADGNSDSELADKGAAAAAAEDRSEQSLSSSSVSHSSSSSSSSSSVSHSSSSDPLANSNSNSDSNSNSKLTDKQKWEKFLKAKGKSSMEECVPSPLEYQDPAVALANVDFLRGSRLTTLMRWVQSVYFSKSRDFPLRGKYNNTRKGKIEQLKAFYNDMGCILTTEAKKKKDAREKRESILL